MFLDIPKSFEIFNGNVSPHTFGLTYAWPLAIWLANLLRSILLYSYAGFSYKVLHMYDIIKPSTVLANAAGFVRLHIYTVP